MKLSANDIQRFWAKVTKLSPTKCWEWQGATKSSGHGMFMTYASNGNKPQAAHRVSWTIHNGPIPAGLCICHHCDNPPCVNPAHLFLGTIRDNVEDMLRKGRHRVLFGTAQPRAVLNDELVLQIRKRLSSGEGVRAVARDLGVSHTCISMVKRGLNWKHV